MSSSRSTFSSSFSTSFSSSTSTSSTLNGQQSGNSYSQQSVTNPSGTTTRTTTQQLGGPSVEETKHYDSQGRELLTAPTGSSMAQRRIQDFEVEDVTDDPDSEADKNYRAAIEDEYAKREGGA